MTDAHCHVTGGDPDVRELLIGREFVGVHPWEGRARLAELGGAEGLASWLSGHWSAPGDHPLGVGEIGLDRLKSREVSSEMRTVFEVQLAVALKRGLPVVLHGAKCWGQVVKAVERLLATAACPTRSPAFLFHGFSRSDGLVPDIVRLGGYISVGPAVLNDHAVNYRALVRKIPLDRLLVETDRTPENAATCPPVAAVLAKTAELRGLAADELEALTDRNAACFA